MDTLDRQARTAGWLYLLLVIPGPFVLIYLPSKLIVRGDAAGMFARNLENPRTAEPELDTKSLASRGIAFAS